MRRKNTRNKRTAGVCVCFHVTGNLSVATDYASDSSKVSGYITGAYSYSSAAYSTAQSAKHLWTLFKRAIKLNIRKHPATLQ